MLDTRRGSTIVTRWKAEPIQLAVGKLPVQQGSSHSLTHFPGLQTCLSLPSNVIYGKTRPLLLAVYMDWQGHQGTECGSSLSTYSEAHAGHQSVSSWKETTLAFREQSIHASPPCLHTLRERVRRRLDLNMTHCDLSFFTICKGISRVGFCGGPGHLLMIQWLCTFVRWNRETGRQEVVPGF